MFAIAREFVLVPDAPMLPLWPAPPGPDCDTLTLEPDCVWRSAAPSICTPYVACWSMRSMASGVNIPFAPFGDDVEDMGRPLVGAGVLGSTRSNISRYESSSCAIAKGVIACAAK